MDFACKVFWVVSLRYYIIDPSIRKCPSTLIAPEMLKRTFWQHLHWVSLFQVFGGIQIKPSCPIACVLNCLDLIKILIWTTCVFSWIILECVSIPFPIWHYNESDRTSHILNMFYSASYCLDLIKIPIWATCAFSWIILECVSICFPMVISPHTQDVVF